MILVYVCGPYTGTDNEREANIKAAEAAGFSVAELDDCTPFVPHTWGRTLHDLWSWERAMSSCIDMLGRCDVLVATGNWQASRGALREIQSANANGIPVVYGLRELEAFVAEVRRTMGVG